MQSKPDPLTVLVVDDEKGIRDGSQRISTTLDSSARMSPLPDLTIVFSVTCPAWSSVRGSVGGIGRSVIMVSKARSS